MGHSNWPTLCNEICEYYIYLIAPHCCREWYAQTPIGHNYKNVYILMAIHKYVWNLSYSYHSFVSEAEVETSKEKPHCKKKLSTNFNFKQFEDVAIGKLIFQNRYFDSDILLPMKVMDVRE